MLKPSEYRAERIKRETLEINILKAEKKLLKAKIKERSVYIERLEQERKQFLKTES